MGIPVRAATGALAWVGAVVLATGVGLTAVNAIGVGIVGAGPQVLSPTEVDARLAAAPAEAAPPPPSAAPVPPPAAGPQVLDSPGGTVVARCVDGVVDIVSTSPYQGWGIHSEGETERGRVRFESGDRRVELRLSCLDGRPISDARVDG